MVTTLLIIVISLQITSIFFSFFKKTPTLDLLRKDILILEKNMEVIRNQMILIITKSNLDANRISFLESLSVKTSKPNKSDNNFH